MSDANHSTDRHHRRDTILSVKFTDETGGVPLEDREVGERLQQQHGRPPGHTKPTSPDSTE